MFLYPLSLAGRLVSMVTAAAAGGGLLGPRANEDHLAAITLEHMHCSCDLVCVQFSVSDNPGNGDLKRPALTCPSVCLPARCASSSVFCFIPCLWVLGCFTLPCSDAIIFRLNLTLSGRQVEFVSRYKPKGPNVVFVLTLKAS